MPEIITTISNIKNIEVTIQKIEGTGVPSTSWGQITGALLNQEDLQDALDTKLNNTGGNINGDFQNSTDKTTKIVLAGDATGNDAQGNPVFNSSPRIDLSTSQVSNYDDEDPDLGGYSELTRLRASTPKAKPTQAWYDWLNKPIAWIVSHFQPQDLLRYPTLADFPVTGVNNNLTGYYSIDTDKYYYWNGSAYIELTPTDERYWYMAIHQHISIETADSTGFSNFTRFAINYLFNVVAVDVVNSHFRIKSGTFKGVDFGAFIIERGRTYSGDSLWFYPNANIKTDGLNKNANTDTVLTRNTGAFKIEKITSADINNPTGETVIGIGTDATINYLQSFKRLISNFTPILPQEVANKSYVDNPVVGTASAGNTVTINQRRGYFTTATLTTMAGLGTPTLTVNSTEIAAGDIVRWSFDNYSGAIGSQGLPHLVGLTTTNGQATCAVRNIHPVNNLNGTIRVFFEVIKP